MIAAMYRWEQSWPLTGGSLAHSVRWETELVKNGLRESSINHCQLVPRREPEIRLKHTRMPSRGGPKVSDGGRRSSIFWAS